LPKTVSMPKTPRISTPSFGKIKSVDIKSVPIPSIEIPSITPPSVPGGSLPEFPSWPGIPSIEIPSISSPPIPPIYDPKYPPLYKPWDDEDWRKKRKRTKKDDYAWFVLNPVTGAREAFGFEMPSLEEMMGVKKKGKKRGKR